MMKKKNEASNSSSDESKGFGRRDFISKSMLLGAGVALSSVACTSKLASSNNNETATASGKLNQAVLAKRKLGTLEVSAIGLGCMSMTSGHYNPPRDKKEMIPVISGAVERGVNFFDTAEYYGPFTNEVLVGEALAPIRNQVVIASKFGFAFEGGKPAGRNSRPEHIRKAVEGMLQRLQTDRIDLLYLHRMDPNVPIEDIAGTVSELIKEGKALHFGLSETSSETTRRAHKIQPVTAMQSQYSLVERVHENGTLALCEELGIGFVPWGPVCRGFLGDKFNEYSRFSEESRFVEVPYFTPEAIRNNMTLLNLIRSWATRKNATPAQFSLAWLLAQKPFIVPIPGTTKLHHLEEDLGALQIKFTPEELKGFRDEFSKIQLLGVREPASVLADA
jgi:aryl-alcohol dehydrogenase-like predicted oxidoreductase